MTKLSTYDLSWELAKTVLPKRSQLYAALTRVRIKQGEQEKYEAAKVVLDRFWNLSSEDYGRAVKMICDYLKC